MTDELLVFFRIILYGFAALILLFFTVMHRERTRKLRNMILAFYFVSAIVSLIARLTGGLDAYKLVNDRLTTFVLFVYVLVLSLDFHYASLNGGRHPPASGGEGS